MNPRISFDARSMLCVPADASRFFMKAADRGADLIVLDLEDGVAFAARERQSLVSVDDAELGSILMHNVFPRLSRAPGRIRSASPALGEHRSC